jgi:hypothetical protein
MSEDWVMVFSSANEYQASLVSILIEDELGIPAVLLDRRDSAYLIGEVELYVRPEDAVIARHFITKNITNE